MRYKQKKVMIMKKMMGLLILLTALSACTDHQTNKVAVKLPLSVNLSEVTYKGHEYLMNYRGGIIHSESCPCRKHIDTIQLNALFEDTWKEAIKEEDL